jgi:hypothetical protein
LTPWIREDSSKNDSLHLQETILKSILFSDYMLGWTYDMNNTLPADTSMSCLWDNGTYHPNNESFSLVVPLMAAPNLIFNIPHNFTLTGDHTLQCNMTNFVSSQMLEFNVILIENDQ